MKKSVLQKISCNLAIFFLTVCATAGGENPSSEVRAYALGNLQSVGNDLSNPAILSLDEQKRVGVSVYNRFQMKELNTGSVYMKYPNRKLDGSLQLSTFGYDDYRLTQIQSGFSKKLFKNFSFGINLLYIHEFSILEETAQNYISSGIGMYYRLNEAIGLALKGENLLATQRELPVSGHFGLTYTVSKQTVFFSEASFEVRKGLSFAVGLEYGILEQFLLRSGFRSCAKTPSFGIAYLFKQWIVEAGFALHPILGISSQIGVSVDFY